MQCVVCTVGQGVPNMLEVSVAQGAAGALYDIIDRVSCCVHVVLLSFSTRCKSEVWSHDVHAASSPTHFRYWITLASV